MSAEQTNIKVAVRVRPYNARELEQNQRCIVQVVDRSTILFDPDEEVDGFYYQGTKQNFRDVSKREHKKLTMEFDRVFETENTNQDIFSECTEPLVEAVLNGYNCCVFVYGATGAGKTFTMLGSEHRPGLTYLTMRDLFDKMQIQQEQRKFDVGVSYLEVYNEQVMNLLTKTGPLRLIEDSNGVVVRGLNLTPIHSADELLRLLAMGNSNRTQHPTDANKESSRSHAIFQVHIRITERKAGTKRTVKFSMIDLAGSERAASTKGIGLRFKEGASINKSLLALGNCINKLADGMKHIPYRDSNLTRILKDSLGGNCRTLMVANVSMSSLTYEDTYNTLKYASRAKKIRTTLRKNEFKSNLPKEFYIKKVNELTGENERLMERNRQLEAKLMQLEQKRNSYADDELKSWYAKIDAVYASAIKMRERVIGIRSKINLLNYCQNLNDNIEKFRKQMATSQREYQEEFVRFSVYIANIVKQRDQHESECPRWQKKLKEAQRDIFKLKKEVADAKCASILEIYINAKDLEVEKYKQKMNYDHLYNTNIELVEYSHTLYKITSSGLDALQLAYNALQKGERMTPEVQYKYDQLLQEVRFKSSEERSTAAEAESKQLKNSSDEDNQTEEAPTGSSTQAAVKRLRTTKRTGTSSNPHLDLDSNDDYDSDETSAPVFEFKKPRVALDETRVISCTDDDCYSSGFETGGSTKLPTTLLTAQHAQRSKLMGNQNLVSDLLSDQNVHLPPQSKDKIRQALLKSKNFNHAELQRTVGAAVQKENFKLNSNCVRKSPRPVAPRAFAGTASSLARRPISRNIGALPSSTTRAAPQVRTNRAASFRVKK